MTQAQHRPGAAKLHQNVRIRCLGFGSIDLEPGGRVHIGRHPTNDLVLSDPTVSRFHATVTWPRDLPLPVVRDNGSQNGTRVDGVEVRGRAVDVRARSSLEIGAYRLAVRAHLVPVPAEPPAVLTESDDLVALFSELGEDLEGVLGRDSSLRELLLRLERERRTGTLELLDRAASVVLCLGRVAAVVDGARAGLPALAQLLRTAQGGYRFRRELEPVERPLEVWFSSYLASRRTTRQMRRRDEDAA